MTDKDDWHGDPWQGGRNVLWPTRGTPFGKRSKVNLRGKQPPTNDIPWLKVIAGVLVILVVLTWLAYGDQIRPKIYMVYLENFDSEKYQQAIFSIEVARLEDIARQIEELKKKVVSVPVDDHEENLRIYRELSKLDTVEGKYKYKITYYEDKKRKYDAAKRMREIETAAEARRVKQAKGFHCLSQWDGAHTGFKDYVHRNMRDPDSFEHIETYIRRADSNGKNLLRMKYRARNGFGGMNIANATAQINNRDCSFVPLSIQ